MSKFTGENFDLERQETFYSDASSHPVEEEQAPLIDDSSIHKKEFISIPTEIYQSMQDSLKRAGRRTRLIFAALIILVAVQGWFVFRQHQKGVNSSLNNRESVEYEIVRHILEEEVLGISDLKPKKGHNGGVNSDIRDAFKDLPNPDAGTQEFLNALVPRLFHNIAHKRPKKPKRNVIFMVSDGFGPTSEVFARSFYQHLVNGRTGPLPPPTPDVSGDSKIPSQLPLDKILVGTSRTRSNNSWITDSAAGATAFSCALKTYNGAIGVTPEKSPCASVLEAAKLMGYKTGLVVRSKITDATPASFSSHALRRQYDTEISTQQVGLDGPFGRIVDLMMGGGKCAFVPKSSQESCRDDERNLLKEVLSEELKSSYYDEEKEKILFSGEEQRFQKVINSRKQFDNLTSDSLKELPLLALFTDYHMSYEIDRDPSKEPSLAEMTEKALSLLKDAADDEDDDKGFFILVEGSRIDMAAHANDPAAHAHEILAYQETVEVVTKFVDENPGTIMISTSDHETGGLAIGRQLTRKYPNYEWFPEVVARVKNSSEAITRMILSTPVSDSQRINFIRDEVLPQILGIEDFSQKDVNYLSASEREYIDILNYIGDMVSRRALLGWSTHGHTEVDVNLYAYAGKHPLLKQLIYPISRNLENIELGTFMSSYLRLSPKLMNVITDRLVHAANNGRLILKPASDLASKVTSVMAQQYDDEVHLTGL